jgi:hypothetical protein
MDEIQRQVRKARRRLNGQHFLNVAIISLTVTLTLALIGLALPRLMVLAVRPDVWTWSWIGGGAALGLFAGWLIAFWKRRKDLQAAIELDRRYGLKERVSSSLALSPDERESEIGQVLLLDAQRRVERIDVREQFSWGWNGRALLPLIPTLAMFVLVYFVPHATTEVKASSGSVAEEKARIKKAVAELEKKFTEKKEALKDQGLKESEAILNELAKTAEKMKKTDLDDQKDALVKLNDLAKEAQQKRNQLAPTEKLKEQLEGMKKLNDGPAEKLADALREGDLGQAAKEMQKLMDKLQKGELNKEEKEKMAEQLEKVQQKLEHLVKEHEAQKQALQEKIEQQKQQGNAAEAAKLQEELEKLQAQDDQMKKGAEQMAKKLGQAAQNLREGKGEQAAQELEQMAQDLQGMQDQLNDLETLDEAMNEIADAKKAMGCKQCQGNGCQECQGQGQGKGKGQGNKPGRGLGEGQGQGERPEEKTDTKGYDSRVRAKPKQGAAVRVGDAGGPNLPGKAQESVKEQVEASLSQEPDPIDEKALPRDQREHSKEYFEKLLKE